MSVFHGEIIALPIANDQLCNHQLPNDQSPIVVRLWANGGPYCGVIGFLFVIPLRVGETVESANDSIANCGAMVGAPLANRVCGVIGVLSVSWTPLQVRSS